MGSPCTVVEGSFTEREYAKEQGWEPWSLEEIRDVLTGNKKSKRPIPWYGPLKAPIEVIVTATGEKLHCDETRLFELSVGVVIVEMFFPLTLDRLEHLRGATLVVEKRGKAEPAIPPGRTHSRLPELLWGT